MKYFKEVENYALTFYVHRVTQMNLHLSLLFFLQFCNFISLNFIVPTSYRRIGVYVCVYFCLSVECLHHMAMKSLTVIFVTSVNRCYWLIFHTTFFTLFQRRTLWSFEEVLITKYSTSVWFWVNFGMCTKKSIFHG